ncbi:MAG: hypothetical protein WHU54_09590 [Candidatus Bathyarchaeia archaeon]
MQNFNGKGYGNKPTMGQQPRAVQNFATGEQTPLIQPVTEKKRVKVAAGWNGNYGPQVSLDIAALHAISRLLQEQGIENGSLRLKFYANSNKLNPKAPDFSFVASDIFGVYVTGQGYQELEIRTQGNTGSTQGQPQGQEEQEEQVPF